MPKKPEEQKQKTIKKKPLKALLNNLYSLLHDKEKITLLCLIIITVCLFKIAFCGIYTYTDGSLDVDADISGYISSDISGSVDASVSGDISVDGAVTTYNY